MAIVKVKLTVRLRLGRTEMISVMTTQKSLGSPSTNPIANPSAERIPRKTALLSASDLVIGWPTGAFVRPALCLCDRTRR